MRERIHAGQNWISGDVCDHLYLNLQKVHLDDAINEAKLTTIDQISVERIARQDWWFIIDRFGRIHTNLTNLAGRLRKHLQVAGRQLANVDISESQLLFSSALLWQQPTPTADEQAQPARGMRTTRQRRGAAAAERDRKERTI